MTAKRLSFTAAALALVILLIIGLAQLGSSTPAPPPPRLTLAQMRTRLAGSAPQLATLHAQANELLGGGIGALDVRLRRLHGEPLVINKWASWCAPCRSEFGVFQSVSVTLGRQVAFIGIDSGDTNRSEALAFLRTSPLSYPSYYDASERVGLAITDSSSTPVTVFFDRAGHEYIHQGPYLSTARLEQDVARYALDG